MENSTQAGSVSFLQNAEEGFKTGMQGSSQQEVLQIPVPQYFKDFTFFAKILP